MKEPKNSIYSAALLGFTSDFLTFVDVELIRFFHRALQLLPSFWWFLADFDVHRRRCVSRPAGNVWGHIARGCRKTATLSPRIRRMDSAIRDERRGVCVGGRGTGRRECGLARLPPVPARLSPTMLPPLCGGDSRGPVSRCNMTRTASQYTSEMRRRVHWGGERAAKCLARHTAVHRYRVRV